VSHRSGWSGWPGERERSFHEPLVIAEAKAVNKLRGLEVRPRARRFFLIDADMVVLGDLSPLARFPDCIAAAPANQAKVPEALWPRLYEAAGLETPETRGPLLREELKMVAPRRRRRFASQNECSRRSPPYYNAGAVFAPWACDLGSLWTKSVERGTKVVARTEEGAAGVHRSDQSGLAVAVAQLLQRGHTFRRLPDVLHSRWCHLYGGRPAVNEMRLFHATAIMRGVSELGELADRNPAPLDDWVRKTRPRLTHAMLADLRRGRLGAALKGWRSLERLAQLHRRFREIQCHQIDDVE